MLKTLLIKIAVMALIWLPILFFSPDPGYDKWTELAALLSVPVIVWELFVGIWQKIFKNRKTR